MAAVEAAEFVAGEEMGPTAMVEMAAVARAEASPAVKEEVAKALTVLANPRSLARALLAGVAAVLQAEAH